MNKFFTILFSVGIFLLVLCGPSFASATTYYHDGNGSLDDINSWWDQPDFGNSGMNGVLPGSGDTGRIGTAISVSSSMTVDYALLVDENGSLSVSGDGTALTIGVSLDVDGVVTANGGSIVINSGAYLNVGSLGSVNIINAGTVSVNTGATMTVYNAVSIGNNGGSGNILNIFGTLTVFNTGTVTADIGNIYIHTGGSVNNIGTIRINPSGVFNVEGDVTIQGTALVNIQGGTYNSYSGSQTTVSGGGTFTIIDGSSFTVDGGFTVDANGTFNVGGQTVSITGGNTGIINSGSGTFTVAPESIVNTNGGTFSVGGSGTFSVDSGGQLIIANGADLDFVSGGLLEIAESGTFSFEDTTLNITGTNTGNIDGSGTVTVHNTSTLTVGDGSTLNITGNLTPGVLNIDTGATFNFEDQTLNITGTNQGNLDGNGEVNIAQGSTINVNATGVLNFPTSGAVLDIDNGTTLNINAGGGLLGEGSLNINAGGIFSFHEATIYMQGANTGTYNGPSLGVFNVDPAAHISVENNAVFNIGPSATFDISGGSLDINSGATLSLEGHTLNITGTNTGNIDGGSDVVTISEDVTLLEIQSSAYLHVLSAGTLNIGGGTVVSSYGGTIDVNAGGTLNATDGTMITPQDGGVIQISGSLTLNSGATLDLTDDGSSAQINSGGTFEVGAAGILSIRNTSFNVQGTLNLNGTLNMNGGGGAGTIQVQEGGYFAINNDAVLNIDNNDTFVIGGSGVENTLFFQNRTLNITGNNTGNIDGVGVVNIDGNTSRIDVGSTGILFIHAYVNAGAALDLGSSGSLNVSSGGTFSVSGLNININGSNTGNINGGIDSVSIDPAAILYIHTESTLHISGNYTVAPGGGLYIGDSNGTAGRMTVDAGSFTAQGGSIFSIGEGGRVDVTAGTHFLYNDVDIEGTLNLSDTGTINIESGSTVDITSSGIFSVEDNTATLNISGSITNDGVWTNNEGAINTINGGIAQNNKAGSLLISGTQGSPITSFDSETSVDNAQNYNAIRSVVPDPARSYSTTILPNGLSIDDVSGLISGSPVASSTGTILVTATNNSSSTGIQAVRYSFGPSAADTTPPSAPTGFTATPGGSTINLSWTNPVSDFASSTVRRSASAFPTSITDGTLVIHTTGTSYADTSLSDGTYYYAIFAKDDAGNVSTAATSTATVDTIGPSISLITPSNLETVSGSSVSLTATASDISGIAGIQFKRATNTNIGSEDTSSPYSVTWDTTALSNGSETLMAVARDGAGNYATSTITVTVDNDITNPIIAEVTPISSTTDTTPSYTFTTNEAGTITYGGSCSSVTTSATSGSNTITLNTLALGTYTDCTVTVTDSSLNVSNTLTITSFTITAPEQSSGGGGSNSSGSRSSTSKTTTTKVTTPVTPTNTPTPAPKFTFLKNIPFGTTFSNDVLELQKFLNAQNFIVSLTGPGSKGFETRYFGPATRAALARFQKAKGITPAVGFFGPVTRGVVNGMR